MAKSSIAGFSSNISISNPKSFKTRKGVEGQVCNVELKDNTGQIRAVFWTQNIKLLKNVSEGDVIQIKGVDIKDGFSGLEANLRQRSTLVHLEDDPSKFPVYEETITNIADIEPDTKVNIIARIKRTSSIKLSIKLSILPSKLVQLLLFIITKFNYYVCFFYIS